MEKTFRHRFGTSHIPTYLGKRSLTNCLGTFFEKLDIAELQFTKVQPLLQPCPPEHLSKSLRDINSDKNRTVSVACFLTDKLEILEDPETAADENLYELALLSKTFLSLPALKINKLQELNKQETDQARLYFRTQNYTTFAYETDEEAFGSLASLTIFARLCGSSQINTTLSLFQGSRTEAFDHTQDLLKRTTDRLRTIHPTLQLGIENTANFENVLGSIDEIKELYQNNSVLTPVYNVENYRDTRELDVLTCEDLLMGWQALMEEKDFGSSNPVISIPVFNFYDHQDIKRAILSNQPEYLDSLVKFLTQLPGACDILVKGIVFDLDAIVLREKYFSI